jgi:hypothetical protein
MIMHGVVKIHGLNTLYYLIELPEKTDELEIVEGGTIEIPPDIGDWPIGTERPPIRTLAVSKTDPKQFKLFKYPDQVEAAGFEPTGLNYGGAYSPWQWKKLVEIIPSMKAFEAIGGNDRPGAMDEAMRYIREAR